MPELEQIALSFAGGGMNGALNPVNLPDQQYARAVNVQIINQRPTTRRGVRVLPFVDTDDDDLAAFQDGNFQGAMFYNPSKGQSQISFAQDDSRIMASVGGRKFEIVTKNLKTRINKAVLREINGLPPGDENLHLAWWYQAENYAIVQDGQAPAWIWDGFTDPFQSTGYDTVDKPSSKLPNAGTVGVYAHGRIVQVVNARQVIVGDPIHKSNLTDSINILDTTEQVYWATGGSFGPPSSMGNIQAAAILPLRDTQHGHGDIMLHCEDGIFSLNINLFPRTDWEKTTLVKHVLLETGARGPYAVALYDGDQFFRSRHGLQSLRSARGESQLMGNPLSPISEEVRDWLDNDYEHFVRFTSVAKWAVARRLLLTVDPWVKGRWRGSRGLVSLNFAPVDTAQTNRAWEGLMTFPGEIASPIQMVNGVFSGSDRLFMFARGDDGKNRFVEFSKDLDHDVLEDGTESRVSSQLITKALVGHTLFSKKAHTTGVLYLSGVKGLLDWGVWARNNESTEWVYWRKGKSCSTADDCCLDDGACDLNDFHPHDFELNLGEMPDAVKNARKVQLLIRWRGVASLEGFKLKFAVGDADEASGAVAGSDNCPEACRATRLSCETSDFEYNFTDNRWEEQ